MENLNGFSMILLSLFGGVVPALLWLSVWLRQDSEHPEPRYRIARAFLAGMMMVPVSIVVQASIAESWFGTSSLVVLMARGFVPIASALMVWVVIEEILKYVAGNISALRSRDADEPIDAVIYMITVALGFAAMENALYLIGPLVAMDESTLLSEGIARFVGATLVHVASSAIVGMAFAVTMFAFVKRRLLVRLIGLIGAIALHGAFNVLIISNEHLRIAAFALVWTSCVALVVLFEKIRQVHLNVITTHEEA